MSLDSLNKLQEMFAQFWDFAEAETAKGNFVSKPLLRVRENWENWWEAELSEKHTQEIEQLATGMSGAEQESFIKWVEDWTWVEDWIGQRFHRHGAGRLVLVQLAQIPLFESWTCLKPYRPENLKGINAIILQSKDEGQCDDVRPLIVLLLPKEAEYPNYAKFNVDMSDAAQYAMEKSRNAALSLLSGVGLLLLLVLWGMLGKKPHRWWILQGSGWAVVGSILLFLFIPSAFVDAIMVPMLWTLVAVTGLLVLYGFWGILREAFLAWKWARLLRQSQLCMLVGGAQTENRIGVDGPSFSVALCLSILLALHEEYPATAEKSWIWWQIFEQLVKKLPKLDATGELTDWGWIKPVGRMEHKIDASCDYRDITDMITPAQKEVRRAHTVQRPNTAMPLSPCVGQAAGVSELRLHRCYHMAHVLLVVGGLVNAFAATRNIIVALLLVVIAVASPDIFWLLHPPPDPEWIFEKCWYGNPPEPGYSGDGLYLQFKTDYLTHFRVYFHSPYWANRERQLDRAKAPRHLDGEKARHYGDHYGDVTIELVKLDYPQVDNTYNGSDYGEIQLIRYQKFWFRPLPPVIIDRISLWHCLKKMREAQNSESNALPRPYSQGFETLPPSH